MKLPWRSILGVGISVFLLWWIFRGEDLSEVLAHIREADPLLLGGAVGLAFLTFPIRAVRWKILLRPLRAETEFRPRFAAVSIGFMANNLLPLRVGEFARAYALSRLEAVTASGAFASLVVERFLDALTILGLLLVAVSLPSFPSGVLLTEGPLGSGVRWAVVLLGVMVVFLLLLLLFPRWVVRSGERLARPLPDRVSRPLTSALEAFLDGLAVLRSPLLLSRAAGWSVFLWLWQSAALWVGFRAFGIDTGFGPAMLVNATIAFGAAIPSAPGFFGTFHAGAVVGLTGVYGIERARTLSFAVGYHLAGFVPITLVGLWYVSRLGISLREVRRSEAQIEEEVEAAHGRGVSSVSSRGGTREDPP